MITPLKIFFLILCFSNITFAYANEQFKNDLGAWTAVNISVPITEKVQSRFQISPRWLDDISDFNQFILHGLLGYKFNEHFSFYQGYAWSTNYIPSFRYEHRPYQEAIISHNIKKSRLEHRFRFEERFIENIDGVPVRGRYRLKWSYPLGKKEKWSLVFFDELFINFNSKTDGPQSGIDQNRIYTGVNYKFNENINSDLGYQFQQVHRKGPSIDPLNHFIFFYLNFQLPQLIRG
jgi:hypothetical protein